MFNYGSEPADRSDLEWRGCPATVENKYNGVVWGVVWEINNEDLPHLDR